MESKYEYSVNEVQAVYTDQEILEFRFNPLIEALPQPISEDDSMGAFTIRAPYDPSDRTKSYCTRMKMTQRIIDSHVPSSFDMCLFNGIERCIMWGLEDRNPLKKEYARTLTRLYRENGGSSINYFGGYHAKVQGFAVIGVSGVGKTTTTEAILRHYPQVIHHTMYRGIPLSMTQIVWLKLDCPKDGSLKSLCSVFFEQVDKLAGTDYTRQYSKRSTLDAMQLGMERVCTRFSIGILVIDEIQHLKAAKEAHASETALNFLVSLTNTIGIPVIMIGTPGALSILQNSFQQAKRGSGQGSFMMGRLEKDKASWTNYLSILWTLQYTRQAVPLTKEMSDAMYYESQGIPFVASHLYKLVQEDAIETRREVFTVSDLHRVANRRLGLTKPLRDAMRRGEDIDLEAVERTIADTKLESQSPKPEPGLQEQSSTEKQTTVQCDAVQRLAGIGIKAGEAAESVILAIKELGEDAPAELVAQLAARLYYTGETEKASKKKPKKDVPTGYDNLASKGMIAAEAL